MHEVYASHCGSNIHKPEFRKHMEEDLALFGNIDNLINVYKSSSGSNIHKEEFRIHINEDVAIFGDDLSKFYSARNSPQVTLRGPCRLFTLELLYTLNLIAGDSAKDLLLHLFVRYRGPTLSHVLRLKNINTLFSFCGNVEECQWVLSLINNRFYSGDV
eukprot:Awhi_evm2s3721